MKPLCRRSPCRLAPAPRSPVSSPGIEPGLRPSHSRVLIRHTPRTFRQAPCRGIEPRPAVSRTAMLVRHTRRAYISVSRPGLEPGSGRSDGPMRSLAPSRQPSNQGRRLDLHQHRAVYRTAASLFGHIGNQQERRESNPVGQFWRLLPLPGGHSCNRPPALRPGTYWRNNYSRSVTFQYASLTNFDQLAIRTSWSA